MLNTPRFPSFFLSFHEKIGALSFLSSSLWYLLDGGSREEEEEEEEEGREGGGFDAFSDCALGRCFSPSYDIESSVSGRRG